jgi:hypothetical protein
MTRFVKDEMILKTTLLKCGTNTLVSCIISFKNKLQSSMISIVTSVVYSPSPIDVVVPTPYQ